MKFFVDFDDVIFNTRDFVFDLKQVFRNNDISTEVFEKYYYDYPYPTRELNGKFKKYNPWKHIETIERSSEIDTKNLKADLSDFLSDLQRYVFIDAIEFFKKHDKNNLYLLSYGENQFQRMKVQNSGISPYFRKIIITDKLKSIPLKEVLIEDKISKSEQIIFLDDRVEQIEAVKKSFPFICTCFFRRKEGRYNDCKNNYCDYEVSDFKIEKILK